MIELQIIRFNKKSFSLPETWEEIIKMGKMVPLVEALLLTEDINANKMRVLSILCNGFDGYTLGKLSGAGNKKERIDLAKEIDDFLAAQIIDLIFPCLDFIYSAEHFYVQPIPSITINGKEYKSLSDKLVNQSGEQWSIAYHAQVLFMKSNNVEHLRAMMAASYLPVKKGVALPFSEELFDEILEAFKIVSIAELQAFYMWYIHADRWWMEKFPWIFPDADDEAETTPAELKNNDGMNIRNIIYELAGGKPNADWDIVKKRTRQDIIYALDRLEDKRIEMEKQKNQE